MPRGLTEKTKSAPKNARYPRVVFSILVITVVSLGFLANKSSTSKCNEKFREDTVIAMPSGEQIGVEVVSSGFAKAKGLGDRKCLPENGGMLFSFETPDYYQFWMKDMKFAIDIIWMDADRKVVSVRENVLPSTYPETFTSSSPAQYVLEINAGKANQYNINHSSTISF